MNSRATLDFLLPGDPQTLTGGYIYDRRILEGLVSLGWNTRLHELDPAFPLPTTEALEHGENTLAALEDGSLVVIDGLAFGAMPDAIARHARRLCIIALIHHPLPDETGLDAADRETLAASERTALSHAHKLIVTSPWTKRRLTSNGIDPDRIGVVMPGTDSAPVSRGSGGSALKLLCVATLTPRKGHAVLFDALAPLRDRAWQLDCVGSLVRDPATADELRMQLERSRLTDRVRLAGEVTAASLAACYARADLFVSASHLEGYGMAHAEALAHGLPMVATAAGAIAQTIPAGAALLVPPGDREALTRALTRVLDDADLRRSLAAAARRARERLPTWPEACERFDAELRSVP